MSLDRHLIVFLPCRLLDSAMDWLCTAKKPVNSFRWTAVEQVVVCKGDERGTSETRSDQLFGERNIFAETEHLLGVLPIARVLQLDGKREPLVGRRKGRDINLSLCEFLLVGKEKAHVPFKLDLQFWKGAAEEDTKCMLEAELVVHLDPPAGDCGNKRLYQIIERRHGR